MNWRDSDINNSTKCPDDLFHQKRYGYQEVKEEDETQAERQNPTEILVQYKLWPQIAKYYL